MVRRSGPVGNCYCDRDYLTVLTRVILTLATVLAVIDIPDPVNLNVWIPEEVARTMIQHSADLCFLLQRGRCY